MNNIAAIFVVKNNPPHIEKSLASVELLADEILIADIGMDTALKENLSRKKNVRIISIERDVPYVELIREELTQTIHADYIFILDPDEIIPADLISFLKKNYLQYDYVRIPRKNIIFGTWIRHSRWWPDYQIRFFKKGMVSWPKIIHAQPDVQGNGLTIDPKEEFAIIHHNYKNLDEYFSKAVRYAKSEAETYRRNNENITFAATVKKAIHEFISRFFSHQGYKDGSHGFILAFLQMIYYFLVYFYYLELKKFEADEDFFKGSSHFFKKGYKESLFWRQKEKKGLSLKEKLLEKML